MKDETIRIGDDIVITICAVRGDRVRVGVTADKNISVHRGEVYDAIKRKNGEVGPGKKDHQ
jgi:carbon storage regulator